MKEIKTTADIANATAIDLGPLKEIKDYVLELGPDIKIPGKVFGGAADSVSCSRSFGEPVTTLEGLEESVASFTAQAATKLRKHKMLAAGCNVYAQIFRSGGGGDCIVRTVMFPTPTDATNEMMNAIRPEIPALFLPGTRYRKTGVVFFRLEKVGTARQMDLFSPPEESKASPLYKTIDALNARYGKGKVFSASEGIGERSWKMKRSKLSKRSSTRWDELIVVK